MTRARNRRLLLAGMLTTAFLFHPIVTLAADQQQRPAAGTSDIASEVARDVRVFEQATESYRTTVNRIVKRAYQTRRDGMLSEYDGQIRKEEAEERVRRIAAITLFENFLRQYPNDGRWTPDVIFRLAELYFEKSNDEYLQATEAYEHALKKLDPSRGDESLVPPQQDYQPTIDLHRKLIADFPKYRLIDGAYYLLGFCLQEMGELERGNEAFLALVCSNHYEPPLRDDIPAAGQARRGSQRGRSRNVQDATLERRYRDCNALVPASRFNAEAWIRVGEYHFDENQLSQAIAAYQQVLNLGSEENPYYDEALYKLAWTYYRADNYPEAIEHFDKLVRYADEEYKQTGRYGSEMRPESIQYLGVSFAEPDWDGDTLPDRESGFTRIEKFYQGRKEEPHVYEVYRRLADIYFDTTKYSDAVKIYKMALQRWPHQPDNPLLQDRIITALERNREFEQAIKEREEFSRLFGADAAWTKHNRNNPDALRKAREYNEQALLQAAVYHHREGQERKKRGLAMNDGLLLQQASREYALAAEAYDRYLKQFPNTKNSYEIRYSYASCLYYSQRFLEAAQMFAKVRDSHLDNRYKEEAAFSATKAYEEYINTQVRAQALVDPPLPDAKRPPEQLGGQSIPDVYRQWQRALDAYSTMLPRSAKTPRLTYKAAEISYRFYDFSDARPRMASIYQRYCQDPIAIQAGKAMLVTYQLEKNLDKMEEWAKNLSSGKCGQQVAGAEQIIEGIQFKRASELMAEAEKAEAAGNRQQAFSLYDRAAVAYLGLVDASPKSSDADKALNNAAVAYEKSRRFESATTVYERIWQQYPDSQFADEALWRSAVNHRKYFAFDKAVQSFLILADSPRFASSSHRTDAIYNAAVILENDQAYGRSAELFLRFASATPKKEEAAAAYFRAGGIYEKMKNDDSAIRIYRSFPSRYGAVPGQGRHVVEASFRIGKIAERRNQWSTAAKAYRQTTAEFKRRGLEAGSDAAEFAAQAEFELVERDVAAFLRTEISGSVSKLPKLQKSMANRANALKDRLENVWQYKRARWTLAAMFRSATIYEHFAKAMATGYRDAPIPRKVKRLGQEAIDIYLSQLDTALDEQVRPIEERAKELYVACVERAKQFGVSNQYTEDARARLYAFDPVGYPVLKRPKIEVVID